MKSFIVAILVFIISANVYGYSGGSGTQASPYQISNVADWQQLMNSSGDWGSSFILTADVNMAGVSLKPVGSASTPFTGMFNGNSHIISNVYINMPANSAVGLFGTIISNGQVANLGLEDVKITANGNVGSLVGYNFAGIINNCYSTGTVSSVNNNVGGLVGVSQGSISNCYSTCSVNDTSGCICVGGFAGGNVGNISNCYSTGNVSASGCSYVGGLVGRNWNGCNGTISYCYSTGQVIGSAYVGGLVGSNLSNVVASFWDMQSSGQTTSDGGTGMTTKQMKLPTTFTSAGWDFVNTWQIASRQTYPYLKSISRINPADINNDGKVDFKDFAIFAQNWLTGT